MAEMDGVGKRLDEAERGNVDKMGEVYNIIPVHDTLDEHPALRYPEVRAAIAALQVVGNLRRPARWSPNFDMLDWLGLTFGFQASNVRNQREHLVLLLANAQMRLVPPPDPIDKLQLEIVRETRRKLTKNYIKWCSFLHIRHNLEKVEDHGIRRKHESNEQKELLYASLYLLIWGEAANLRFMPECLCFIFHHMSGELNRILDMSIDDSGDYAKPASQGDSGFLYKVIKPIYDVIQAEAAASAIEINPHSANPTKIQNPHSAWRNYDDMNEYFWSHRCLTQLRWPLEMSCNYLVKPEDKSRYKVGKTGFVEQRSFWNIYRSFDRVWIGLILMLQILIIVAFRAKPEIRDPNSIVRPAPLITDPQTKPFWNVLTQRDSQAHLLSIFITWSALRVLQAFLDFGMQASLISRGTLLVGLRMTLKFVIASVWVVLFSVYYSRMWGQRDADGSWSTEALNRLYLYLGFCAVFVAPEVLALLLFIIPYIRNFVETRDWRIFSLLTWWFQSHIFVGRGLRESVWDNIKYSLFWLVVLAAKFSFSYFLQVLPLVKPTRATLELRGVNYRWHEFIRSGGRTATLCLWAPVMIIYFMDMQIWYSVFSALVGAFVGLLAHLGEIRDLSQLKARFHIFPLAVQFNLMPEDTFLNQRPNAWRGKIHNWWAATKNFLSRLKLRYGVVKNQQVEPKTMESGRFRHIWNEIILIFREEDIISDRELELLSMPSAVWNISVTQWPSVLLSNEFLVALGLCEKWYPSDRALWRKVASNEYRRCAVIEAYESIRHVLGRILRGDRKECQLFEDIFRDIDKAIKENQFRNRFDCDKEGKSALRKIHGRLVDLIALLLKRPLLNDLQKVVDALQNLYEDLHREFAKDKLLAEDWRKLGASSSLLFVDAVELPDPTDEVFFAQLKRLYTTMSTREALLNVPKSLEAKRRITFFSNSLFMTMPRAPQVDKMLAFSVLTPYYEESVMYDKDKLDEKNEDGVSTLFYLQKIFKDDWECFKERMVRQGFPKKEAHMREDVYEDLLISNLVKVDDGLELRLWASYRGQTLVRTVRGMMYYQRALQKLAFLDVASEKDLEGYKELMERTSDGVDAVNAESVDGSIRSTSSYREGREEEGRYTDYQREMDAATAAMKFTYVVACQIYGTQKRKGAQQAKDILYLMKTWNALRIAYVDEEPPPPGSSTKVYSSVLVKWDPVLEQEVEIYRVELPGPVRVGEGKPENQNHALIFTRGDAVQTIDMNQENYFEEALKMRNLLQEFRRYHGKRKPAILGVREHVFTGSVSSLAWFMSAQETSFVTLGQRVLAEPLKVRMHYGHPDVFDRLWFIPRGGLSKASKVINISEDIFAGFNTTLRGGTVTHHEYIQVGKGRDVGLNQIAMFEAKVASGNGEQMLSRDVYRLGHRVDFFRMLSVYYTTVGFFVNNMLVVLTVYAFLWGRVYLALSGIEASISKDSTANGALTAALNQQFVVQMGLFTALPMIVENTLEKGFLPAIWEFLTMQLQLASVFFTFSMGTRAHFFGRTILHGGAKYRATGRGFVVQHEKFDTNYRLYARSHFIKGLEIIFLLIVYQLYGSVKNTTTYILTTFSCWFLGITWILAPFLFNPSGFDWLKSVDDFDEFMTWIWYKGGVFVKAEYSWQKWWEEEQEHLLSTGFWGKCMEIILSLRFFFFQYGIVYRLKIADGHRSILVYLISWTYLLGAGLVQLSISRASEKYGAKKHYKYRAIQAIVFFLLVLTLVLLFVLTDFSVLDIFTSILAFVPTGWGLLSICLVLRRPFLESTPVWPVVVEVARLYELGMGFTILAPVVVLSWVPGIQAMQTRILFSEAFSRGLNIQKLLTTKKQA
ncbi:hypothetical protein R1sor_010654 [Riccia sorocarpa]|uniref:1,3-beta-glucan synthase n=1 Tax=Riccia sorocarpa TaxID=122646 RepID=A0ABD3HYY4_9MARC